MSDKPKSPFFQFHLMTLVLMVLLLGLFLYMNTLPGEQRAAQMFVGGTKMVGDGFGWPVPFYVENYSKAALPQGLVESPRIRQHLWYAYVVNAASCLAALLVTARISEYLIRRREARKP